MTKPKVLVALSGGVDSSVTAFLLKKQGFELIGVTLKQIHPLNCRTLSLDKGIKDVSILARDLNFPYFVLDVTKKFKDLVINNFVDSYKHGITPNPCILCNEKFKWETLINTADEFECEYIATGHYAAIRTSGKEHLISRPKDLHKDQSYFLWRLTDEHLKRTIFPLSDYTKEEIKKIAASNGLLNFANKKESYNICFIPDKSYKHYINNKLDTIEATNNSGLFVLPNNEIVGEYRGIWNFTIGQKVDLGKKSKEKLYVIKIDSSAKKIVLGPKNDLYKKIAVADAFRLAGSLTLDKSITLEARWTYKSTLENCKIHIHQNQLIVNFENPVFALTPGQSIVFYQGNNLVGGGIINSSLNDLN